MSFVPARCPSCSRDIQVPSELALVKCMFCGADVKIPDAIKLLSPKNNSGHGLAIADAAYEAGNLQEAYDFYNKALELDSKNVLAWIGKGKAAGWQSTLERPRIDEMVIAFAKAQDAGASVAEVKTMALDLYKASMAVSSAAMEHYEESSEAFARGGRLSELQRDMASVTVESLKGVASALKLDNSNASFAASAASRAHVCFLIFQSSKAELETQVEYFLEALKKIDPSEYGRAKAKIDERDQSSAKSSSSSGACFVVTATLGNESNVFVRDLRCFRDEVLTGSSSGQKFVNWYYRNGPAIAQVIGRSYLLRLMSFGIVVAPAWLLLRASSLARAKNVKIGTRDSNE